MGALGINEPDLEAFISDVYKQCRMIGLGSREVANNPKQILRLTESVPISAIAGYIDEKLSLRNKLESDIQQLEADELAAKSRLGELLNQERVTRRDLERYVWKCSIV
jgi:ATP-dependent protease HslVU (ClpYQ) peptidase subunit